MGKRKRSAVNVFSKNKNFNRPTTERKDYELPPRENELFVKYYKGLGIVPEGEWDDFYNTLQRTLPVTFRITGFKSEAQEILSNIKGTFFSKLLSEKIDGNDIPPPKCLPWYPNEMGWQLDLTRKVIRSSECLSRLHDFLVSETECGALSRQEAVSMIPPLVMDIESHHKVLDMCAAPGSKTTQLIEYLHSSCKNEDELPTGYVVANDADNKRCYMMVHQIKRLQSPCFVITNHDATVFPKFRNTQEGSQGFQQFDRVLCDVPCSGDGTMRKNFDVWSKWHPLQGANMHGLQCKILRRGVQLLAKGGRLVYSTCSLNPVEDEAVIADILRSSEGALELIDINDQLPGLKYSKGLNTWKVMLKCGDWIESQKEVPIKMTTQYRHTIFPPTPEEAEQFHLDKCIRILPHQQDSGGFFVAALRKVRHLPGSKELKEEEEREEKEKIAEEATNGDNSGVNTGEVGAGDGEKVAEEDQFNKIQKIGHEPAAKKRRFHGCYKEDPFFFMESSDPIWPSLRDFYGLAESIPPGQIMFRSQAGKRTLYFVSKAVRDVVNANVESCKFINMGVKMFSRSPSPLVPQCDFRITQECLHLLHWSVGSRKAKVNKQDAIRIIGEDNPFTDKLSMDAQGELNNLEPGSTIFVFSPSEEESNPKCDVVFCGWRGKVSVRCFGSKTDRAHMLMLLGEDLKEINKRNEEERQARKLLKVNNDHDDLPPLEDKEAKEEGEGGESIPDGGEEGKEEEMKEETKEEMKEETKEEVKEDVKEELKEEVKEEVESTTATAQQEEEMKS